MNVTIKGIAYTVRTERDIQELVERVVKGRAA